MKTEQRKEEESKARQQRGLSDESLEGKSLIVEQHRKVRVKAISQRTLEDCLHNSTRELIYQRLFY